MQRYTSGGFLTGDVIKFKDNAFKDGWFKTQPSNFQEKLQNMAKSGLNLRVSAVKNIRPAIQGAGNTDNMGTDVNLDITSEIAPGRYADFVTIPAKYVEPVSSYPNLPDVPEVFRKDDPSKRAHITPKQVKDENQEVPFYSPKDTRLSDHGDKKMVSGDRSLTNKNVKIPASPAVNHKDPASYTANYLP